MFLESWPVLNSASNELCLNTIAREIVLLRILVGAVVIAESNFTFIDIFWDDVHRFYVFVLQILYPWGDFLSAGNFFQPNKPNNSKFDMNYS